MGTGDYAQDTKQMFIPAQNVYLSVPLMDSTHGYWMTLMMMLSSFWLKENALKTKMWLCGNFFSRFGLNPRPKYQRGTGSSPSFAQTLKLIWVLYLSHSAKYVSFAPIDQKNTVNLFCWDPVRMEQCSKVSFIMRVRSARLEVPISLWFIIWYYKPCAL